RYKGLSKFADGPWVGVELDLKTGRNNGCVGGVRYFDCPDDHGVFVRPSNCVPVRGYAFDHLSLPPPPPPPAPPTPPPSLPPSPTPS
ncbi:unnamed protein product, partial [Choristocarpus tenellus]